MMGVFAQYDRSMVVLKLAGAQPFDPAAARVQSREQRVLRRWGAAFERNRL
jgi:hypothetical protein